MLIKVVFPDGTWFLGDRKTKFLIRETTGTHHFVVVDGDETFKHLINKWVAVPIMAAKYFILWADKN